MSVLKVARLRSREGGFHYAGLREDGGWERLDGDLASGFTPTGLSMEPAAIVAPVAPPIIYGIGLNYKSHAQELGRTLPDHPLVFMKQPRSVQNPGAPIELPRTLRSNEVDYEGELAVIIGKPGKNITLGNALDHVAGYTCATDVSARDWQFKLGGGQFSRSKTFDTFCPLGPLLITPEAIPDPQALLLTTTVNGELRQKTSTTDMIFSVAQLIVFLSGSTTLETGTVILTGTPGGTGNSFSPPKYLQAGDIVTTEIDAIGALTNPVIEEQF